MFLMAFSFLIVWLPLLRSLLDGDTYQWGTSYFGTMISGAGVTASLMFLVVQLVFYVGLFWSIFRAQKRMIAYLLTIVWWIHFFGNLLFDIIVNGDTMFHGDTLNVHISISMIVIPLSILAAVLIVLWIRRDLKSHDIEIQWSRKNKMLALLILGPLPLQAILLRIGEPHATTDEIGVIITILQCLLLPLIFFPYKSKKTI
jgi:hypothetical protein